MSEKANVTRVTTKDKKAEKTYTVEEISNGWILSVSTEGKDTKGNWKYDTVKTFYKENPMDTTKLNLDVIRKAIGKTDNDGDEIVK